ncbi:MULTISPECIES: DUF1190 domain-containing protein [Bosea]|uniref:DUF1190 domain-containing protein n=1 Tax=Bosea TaxID=85413 RepID=UPI00215061F0|nr:MULTISPECIES: DUF1190 domain-containing protein [Bosea]MCR4521735.1 DUF1190 domain-containing protein [Bosea sp. 47.2.35]MDR6827257.1 uncharacterized protein YgiB involved in biofilm formation [Bosea robiniae]MDR6893967.1 uncharacterized protein YgiB involved in biofilm formation [Bosea sp. BE109]MDR7137362.1 uncharacterized protein YgiB involved in biofilm formation [Bosea sp. BE168]MDR7174062.1 uncharacterized protein YgiB involved in biofilm formation [Bosea sp. BE271]
MKRSSQIGLAAAGVLLVATVWSMTGEDPQENLVYNSLSDCRSAGQVSASQCETAFSEASAARLKDAPKFQSQSACEAQYGANGCGSASIGGAQYFIPALAGFMLARGLSGGAAQAQPLMPPTTSACPPGSTQPECQQARSSSSSSSGGSYGGSGSRSRAYSTTSGRSVTAAFAAGARVGSTAATSTASRGGFGSIARSFSSHSSS